MQALKIRTTEGAETTFQVEIAETPSAWAKGLMYRTTLDPNNGMLFLFGDEKPRAFWMKNTFIALDILFIDKCGTILQIANDAMPQSLERIISNAPAFAALEVTADTAERLGITAGDDIIHPAFQCDSSDKAH